MRTSLIVSLAVTLGALLGYFGATHSLRSTDFKAAPIAVPVPMDITPLSEEDARQQRANNYQSVRGLADVLSLPTQFARTEALVALAGRSDASAIAELMIAARGVNPNLARLQMSNILLSRFVELDPLLALDHLLSSVLAAEQSQLIGVLFSGWAKTDLNAALHGARQLSEPEHIQAAGDAILQAHAQHGEELAREILTQLPGEYDATHYNATALAERADTEPQQALEEALLIKDRWQRITAVQSVFEKWAQSDVVEALNQLKNLQDAELKNNVQDAVTQRFIEQDPAAALEWIEENATGQLRDTMLQTALGRIVQENPQQAIAYLEKLPTSQRDSALMTVAMSWATKDPEAAVDWVAQQDLRDNGGTLSFMAQIWAERDPAAAERYLEQLPKSARPEWIASIAQSYAQRDPVEALKWLQQYKTEPGYSSALDNALSEWSSSDPRAALAFIERQPDKEKLPNAVVNAVSRLAQENMPDAVAMVEAMPEGSLRQSAAATLAQQWARDDMQGLDNWIASLDAGPSRDSVIETLIMRLGDGPDRAVSLINSLQSEESRVRSGMQLLYVSGADGDQARELAASLDLPEDRRREIIDTVRQYQDPSPAVTPFGIVLDR